MANPFKEYRDAYKNRHKNDVIEEDLITPKNTGATVPNPKTLGNKKRPQGKYIKNYSSEEE